MSTTKIEWADRVWNPMSGCTKVSTGCTRCYAEKFAKRLRNNSKVWPKYLNGFQPTLYYDELRKPLTWRKSARIFVCSMGDLFHSDVPFDFIDSVMATIAAGYWHTFIILTKRPERMLEYFMHAGPSQYIFPLNNLWLGISAENQETFDERVAYLLRIPAVIRFVSLEPLLSSIHIFQTIQYGQWDLNQNTERTQKIHWVIAGGETGSGARPVHPQWIRDIKYQCHAAGLNEYHVPFFFKSWGEYFPGPETIDGLNRLAKDHPTARIRSSFTFPDGQVMFHIGHKASGRLINSEEYLQFPNTIQP